MQPKASTNEPGDIIRDLTARVNELQTAVDESYAEMSRAEKRNEEERRYFTGAVLTACGVTTFDKGDPTLPNDGPPTMGWALQTVRAVVAERDRLRASLEQRAEVAPASQSEEHCMPTGVGCWEYESGEEKILADAFDPVRRQRMW